MKVALYARVSTDDKGQDPGTQIDIIKEIAIRRGYEIEGEYVDYASGKDPNRPKWKDIMAKAAHHDIDIIMALRLDRIMRSVIHLSSTVEQLKTYNVKLMFTDFEFDPNNPNSVLTLNLLSAIAQWERQIISARTTEGLAHRKNKGVKLGNKFRDDIPFETIARMRIEGKGWKRISDEISIPKSTILGRREEIEKNIASLRNDKSANVPMVEQGSAEEGSK